MPLHANRKLGSDGSKNLLGRMGHHIRSSYQISTHSHERFLIKAWRKCWYLFTAKQEVGVQQVLNLLWTFNTSYQTNLPSFESFPCTVSKKSLTKVRTDRQTYVHVYVDEQIWVKLYAPDESSRGHKKWASQTKTKIAEAIRKIWKMKRNVQSIWIAFTNLGLPEVTMYHDFFFTFHKMKQWCHCYV